MIWLKERRVRLVIWLKFIDFSVIFGEGTVISNIHLGQLPKMVFCVLVDSDNFHGAKDKNPFNFVHHDLTQFSVEVDGKLQNYEKVGIS